MTVAKDAVWQLIVVYAKAIPMAFCAYWVAYVAVYVAALVLG